MFPEDIALHHRLSLTVIFFFRPLFSFEDTRKLSVELPDKLVDIVLLTHHRTGHLLRCSTFKATQQIPTFRPYHSLRQSAETNTKIALHIPNILAFSVTEAAAIFAQTIMALWNYISYCGVSKIKACNSQRQLLWDCDLLNSRWQTSNWYSRCCASSECLK